MLSSRDPTKLLEEFRIFLRSAWPAFCETMRLEDWDDDFDRVNDWLEANWAVMVARQLLDDFTQLQPISPNIIHITDYKYCLGVVGDPSRRFWTLGNAKHDKSVGMQHDQLLIMKDPNTLEYPNWGEVRFEVIENPRRS